MFTLLLGSDDFSKKEFIDSLVKDKGTDLRVFSEGDQMPNVGSLTEADLFSRPKVFVLQNIMPGFSAGEMEKLILSANHIVISVKSLDKRKKENKDLIAKSDASVGAGKKITVKEFVLPHGRELNEWIAKRVQYHHGKISKDAVELLAVRLGRDSGKEIKAGGKVVSAEEVFNLWQADGEIRKLMSFAAGAEIGAKEVGELVSENGEVDVFDLTNAIADNQKNRALELLNKFLSAQTGSDEKGGIIKLNALLSEQFRNVAMIQDFLLAQKSEDQILEATGWKSGRLFVIKKIASRFPSKKILDFLNKLSALDEELKTSSTPPRVLLDLIVSQLLT
jgi:DNA polymerase III delta subunit